METDTGKHMAYLDLEDIEEKARFFFFISRKTEDDVYSLEERFLRWQDLIDR